MTSDCKLAVGFLSAVALFASSFFSVDAQGQSGDDTPIHHEAISGHGGSSQWLVDWAASWDSHYVSEGRDNLDGSSLWSTAVTWSWSGWSLGGWLAESSSADYEEYNLFLSYGQSIGSFDWYLGVQSVGVVSDDQTDREVGAGLAYTGFSHWVPSLDYVYSDDSGGSFLEASLRRDVSVTEVFSLSPYVMMGWNRGYVSAGHRGSNHVALGMEWAFSLNAHLSLGGHLTKNWGLNKRVTRWPDDAALKDFVYGGVSVLWEF